MRKHILWIRQQFYFYCLAHELYAIHRLCFPQIRRIAQGTKIYSISTKNFSECYIGLPSKPEQTKFLVLFVLFDYEKQQMRKHILWIRQQFYFYCLAHDQLAPRIFLNAILDCHQNLNRLKSRPCFALLTNVSPPSQSQIRNFLAMWMNGIQGNHTSVYWEFLTV